MSLVHAVLQGDRLSLSRLLTQIENETPEGRHALAELFPRTGGAHLIGVTGPPGTGKSTLVNQLAYYYRHPPNGEQPVKVAIVAVDPTSPFTGGAVLGDRIRMRDLSGDPDVFIRSMASRGSLGGLAHATSGLVQAFDAAGFDVIFIETVGAGQAEVDIARLAHTTLVVEAPGLGDDVQAIKAGILEIADILVVNKADRPDADHTERALRNMLQLAHPVRRVFQSPGKPETEALEDEPFWVPPVMRTVATEGAGIPGLIDEIAKHRAFLHDSGDVHRRDRTRLETELHARLQDALMTRWREALSDGDYEHVLSELVARRLSPDEAAATLLEGVGAKTD